MADHEHRVETRALTVTLGAAAACWVVAVTQMRGMDMGVATELGSFRFFVSVWAAMMAAMMLPGAAPAVIRYARTRRRSVPALGFVAAYLAVWTVFGVAAYVVYRPHGAVAAGIVTTAAGLYELTPLKRQARRRCQQRVRSGLHLGLYCIGSSIGLMLLLLAVGAMSLAWMSVIAVLVLVQKLLPPRAALDVPVASAIVAFGLVILIAPTSVPGLVPSM
jgi:predicted metal-binding membrane protein